MQNPFVWHDLMTPDVAAAKTFYGAVVGWTFTEQMPAYTVANVEGDKGMGGIMATPAELGSMHPFWAGYVYTPDVDAACARIKKLGGVIHREPWDIPDVLRMAVVGDPTGGNFNIMQPLSTEERKLPSVNALGTVGWNELHAGDLDAAWDFYAAMFGWTKGMAVDMGAMGIYQVFQIDGRDAGGMMKRQDPLPAPMWLYYFNVDGIAAAAARVTTAGGKITMGPHQVPGGLWIVSGLDPQGAIFNLLSTTK
jgi:predicted enzyme related to lactoylglutathione lyase